MFVPERVLTEKPSVCRAPDPPKTAQIAFPPTEAAAAAPARSTEAATPLRLFLHLSDENMKGCSHSCRGGGQGGTCSAASFCRKAHPTAITSDLTFRLSSWYPQPSALPRPWGILSDPCSFPSPAFRACHHR